MMRTEVIFTLGIAFASALAACSGDDNTPAGGGGSAGIGSLEGGTGGMGTDGGLALRAFTPPPNTLAPGQLLLAASGEHLAQTGYDFPPATADDPAFVDGWEIRFDHLLVTFDKITLSLNPDTNAGDQSQTGPVVAEADGPWAIDLHRANATDIPGKEADETAIPFATMTRRNDGTAFLTDGTRYAVGFESVAASATAINVNLDGDALILYQTMVQDQCTVLYTGTATFNGQNCQTPAQGDELASIPRAVHFNFCFKSPTKFVNCENQDNMGAGVGTEDFQRGVAFPTNTFVTGEVTFHTDHPFWDSTVHDSPAHFDQFAAQAVGQDADIPTVTLQQVVGVSYAAFTDGAQQPLPWRSCVDATRYTPPPGTQLSFNPHGVSGLRDYYDFTTFNQRTQGHWNGEEGLCAVIPQPTN